MLWSNRILNRFLLALALCAGLAGCGYGLASDMPTVLGAGVPTLKITGVEQPTMYPWVVYTVRSAMREEITARNIAEWVDSGNADFNMHIRVGSFTMRRSVASSIDQTLIYTGTVTITAIVYNGADNSEMWRRTISYSNEFNSDLEEEAGRQLFTQAVRRLADSMRNTF